MQRPADRLWITPLFVCLATCASGFLTSVAAQDREQISMAQFRRVVGAFLADHKVSKDGVISQRDVVPLLDALQSQGMQLDRKEFLKLIPTDQSAMVRLLRSDNGRKFASKTSHNRLMFDRLDRIAKESGGERMLRDLMKLPDATRYAKMDTGPGMPDLIDFLPKTRSGKTRRVKDYTKPTGKLYTWDHVLDHLAKQVAGSRNARR